jgi:hypothetical protein
MCLLTSVPGRTDMMEHAIKICSARPVRLQPYRITSTGPKLESLECQVGEMLEGIIKQSNSPWEISSGDGAQA